jgi:chemotaxis protein CheD
MNHILLPGSSREAGRLDGLARFGADAVELLIAALLEAGASRRRLEAKLFGGGHVIPQLDEGSSPGRRNAEFVRDLMARERIAVASADLGGYAARKVWFRTDTAAALLKRVPVTLAAAVREEEGAFRRRVLRRLHDEAASCVHLLRPAGR